MSAVIKVGVYVFVKPNTVSGRPETTSCLDATPLAAGVWDSWRKVEVVFWTTAKVGHLAVFLSRLPPNSAPRLPLIVFTTLQRCCRQVGMNNPKDGEATGTTTPRLMRKQVGALRGWRLAALTAAIGGSLARGRPRRGGIRRRRDSSLAIPRHRPWRNNRLQDHEAERAGWPRSCRAATAFLIVLWKSARAVPDHKAAGPAGLLRRGTREARAVRLRHQIDR